MTAYARGGLIPSDRGSVSVHIERIGQTADGKCLYSINGGSPEPILSAKEVRELLGVIRHEGQRQLRGSP